MVEYDATNPLHQTGIKMIDAAPADPTVAPTITYAVEGIAAYGLAAAKSDGPGPQPTVPGDVNGDGSVTASDVTAIYNYLLNNDMTFSNSYDVNGDGNITSADVTFIYNILLGN